MDSSLTLALGISLLFGIGLLAYLSPGEVPGGAGHSHVARPWLVHDILQEERNVPIWTNRYHCGYPIGLYYGFVHYFLTAGVAGIFRILEHEERHQRVHLRFDAPMPG
ncbi:MAG: hypothetical protein GF346_01580 [Candidatus Eisenbacteria bacterium]|nr:hypothetical protein [Candidatus Latescibacterota bacterium]MBD3301121.1 hypothetical protein [Candidatus Eisenbacteria bacterium]